MVHYELNIDFLYKCELLSFVMLSENLSWIDNSCPKLVYNTIYRVILMNYTE